MFLRNQKICVDPFIVVFILFGRIWNWIHSISEECLYAEAGMGTQLGRRGGRGYEGEF